MVSSITSLPYYSYLSTLTGQSAPAATVPAVTTSNASSSSASAPASTTSSPLTSSASSSELSSLLGSANGYGPEVLSLLQQNGTGGFSPISSLLGGSSASGSSGGVTTLLAELYASSTAAALQTATNNATPATTPNPTTTGGSVSQTPKVTSSVDSLIQQQTQASIAYNQTLVQNTQAALNADSYGPDGITPLIA